MSRPAKATINLSALRNNLEKAKEFAPNAQNVAIIKADGYGHGLVRVAKALKDSVERFGVASIEEALALRNAGISNPIVLLEGVFEASELTKAGLQKLEVVVHHIQQLEMLEKLAASTTAAANKLNVWLKLDTGMHRLGFPPAIFHTVWERLQNISLVNEVVIMSHLANADDQRDTFTKKQSKLFSELTEGLSVKKSIANSAGILGWPDTRADINRPGIMLYGASPLKQSVGADFGLQPVMTLSTELIAVNYHKKGEPVGYGGKWVCPEDMPVGVAAIGYGDGYPRHAKTGTPVLVNEQRCHLIGRVSMDMICVDLRTQPEARIGDPVVLFGDNLPVEEVAKHATTISYEILCGVTQRVKFVDVQ